MRSPSFLNEQLQIKNSQITAHLKQSKLQLIQINAQIKTLDVQILAEDKVIQRRVSCGKADLAF